MAEAWFLSRLLRSVIGKTSISACSRPQRTSSRDHNSPLRQIGVHQIGCPYLLSKSDNLHEPLLSMKSDKERTELNRWNRSSITAASTTLGSAQDHERPLEPTLYGASRPSLALLVIWSPRVSSGLQSGTRRAQKTQERHKIARGSPTPCGSRRDWEPESARFSVNAFSRISSPCASRWLKIMCGKAASLRIAMLTIG